jgi:hypothetical protein
MATPVREWDARLVPDPEVEKHLNEGWEPLGATQITIFDRLSNQPIGMVVAWSMRRRRPRLTLPLPEAG